MEHLKQLLYKYLVQNRVLILFAINIYFFLLGSFWISMLLYFRIFKQHKDYLLIELKNHISLLTFQFLVLFVLIHATTIISITLGWYRAYYNKKPNPYLLLIVNKLNVLFDLIYWKPLNYFYEKIEGEIPGSGKFFLFLERYWSSTKKGKYYSYFVIILFEVLPKLIIAITFFVDIVIYSQIKYFFYVMILGFIPILFNIFLKLLDSFHNQNISVLTNYFSIIQGQGTRFYNEDETMVFYEQYFCEIKDEYVGVVDLNEELNYILQLKHILMYVYDLRLYMNRIMPYVTFFTSGLYFVAGIIRLSILYS